MKKKVLITGVNGFIGSSLRGYLCNYHPSYQVFGVDIRGATKDSRTFDCNINDAQKIKTLLADLRPHIIFHLAGGRVKNDKRLLNDNLITSKTLFDTVFGIKRYSPRIIIPGTAAEYGEVRSRMKLIRETYEAQPLTWYGFVKLIQTNLGLVYAKKGLNIVMARMFNIMGAGTPPTLVAGRFARDIVSVENRRWRRIIKTGSLAGKRDFLDIHDVCSALLLLSEKGRQGEIYNVCSGKAVNIRELLGRMLDISGADRIRVRENPEKDSGSFSIVGSNAKLKKTTSWKAAVNLDNSLRSTLDFYRRR